MTRRVLVVEQHRLVRQGIRFELEATEAFVVEEAATGDAAIAAAAAHPPDVVLLASRLGDRPSVDVCSAILERHPGAVVIVLSAQADEASVRAAVDAGARAYLLQDADDLDLRGTIELVLAGDSVIHPRAAAALLDSRARPEQPTLSGQELNVVRLVAEGLTNPEIGKRLYLSRHTVKEYVSNALHKLGAANRIEAVRKATELGLIGGMQSSSPGAPGPRQETVVYNESGGPIRSSDIKVTPLKLDKLEPG